MGNYTLHPYFQNMKTIGSEIDSIDNENCDLLTAVENEIRDAIKEVQAAGKPDEKVNERGEWTVLQRIHELVDDKTFVPLNSLFNPQGNKNGSTGIVKGLGKVAGKWCLIVGSDNKKLAGAWVAGQAENLLRASDTAKRLNIPLVYVLNCSGVKLNEQEKVYANRRGGGTPFYRNAELNQLGIPVIVGIWGTNPAGGGYHSISPTVIVAHKDANMAVGGAGIVGGMNPKGYIDEEGAQDIMENIKYLPSGDSALVMEFGNEISKEINASISQVVNYLKDEKLNGIVDILPTYRSILINYDPRVFTFNELVEKLDSIEIADTNLSDGNVRLIEIPTLYGGEYGPDIANVAKNAGLSEDEVIKIHAGVDYLVYMMGFLPGFTYLGGLDERIATPRLSSPRLKIVPGSVGIAGTQTGMYPLESPGGWQLIGRTPVKLYDSSNPESPVFINAGDYIRYVSVDDKTYNKILEEVNAGTYKVNIKEVKRGELRG